MSMTPHQDAIHELVRQMEAHPTDNPRMQDLRRLMIEMQMALARMADDGAEPKDCLHFGMNFIQSALATLAKTYRAENILSDTQMQMAILTQLAAVIAARASGADLGGAIEEDHQFEANVIRGRA